MWSGGQSLYFSFQVWEKTLGQTGVAVSFEPHPHGLFLLAVDFIARLVFILHWTVCYTLYGLKFLVG